MSELKWNWAYAPYLDPPEKQKESAQNAGYVKVVSKDEADKVIAKLKDKCQMHDFFWEGCGFAKRGFKNIIAVSEAFDDLEAENAKLKDKLRHYPVMAALIDCGNKEIRHSNYKRCLAMADNCEKEAMVVCYNEPRIEWLGKWKLRWLELAEKFKEAK